MRVILNYTEEVKLSLDQIFFAKVAEETLKRCGVLSLQNKKKITLNAVSVSAQKIQELNRVYREKDAVTDILSFGEYADVSEIEADTHEEVFLGELFFCNSFIEDAAREDGVTLEHEMVYIFSHGILHLLGFDHSEKMFSIQDEVTAYFASHKKTVIV